MTEPNKESVRIAPPSRPDVKPDTVRIVLPERTPVAPMRRVPPKITPWAGSESPTEPSTISPRRPAITPLPATSEPRPVGSTQAGPKNETARINVLPRPAPAQPAIDMAAASQALDQSDAIPRSFGWGLVGLATLIFLIQIWIYVVS